MIEHTTHNIIHRAGSTYRLYTYFTAQEILQIVGFNDESVLPILSPSSHSVTLVCSMLKLSSERDTSILSEDPIIS